MGGDQDKSLVKLEQERAVLKITKNEGTTKSQECRVIFLGLSDIFNNFF